MLWVVLNFSTQHIVLPTWIFRLITSVFISRMTDYAGKATNPVRGVTLIICHMWLEAWTCPRPCSGTVCARVCIWPLGWNVQSSGALYRESPHSWGQLCVQGILYECAVTPQMMYYWGACALGTGSSKTSQSPLCMIQCTVPCQSVLGSECDKSLQWCPVFPACPLKQLALDVGWRLA